MYKHILIATDGSDLAQQAVMHGIAIAKAFNAEVTIVTATPVWSVLQMAGYAQAGAPRRIEDFEIMSAKTARNILTACAEEARKAGVSCHTLHVKDTEPDEAILAAAKSRQCDLIVMASHSRGPLGRMLLGSVAMKVLTYAAVPVHVVR